MSSWETAAILICWCLAWTLGFMSFSDGWQGRKNKEIISSTVDFAFASWYFLYPLWLVLRIYTEVYVL